MQYKVGILVGFKLLWSWLTAFQSAMCLCPEVLQYLFVELIVCCLQVLEKKAKDQLQFQTFEDSHKSRRKSSVQTTCSDLPFELFCPVSS
jgi:hypothetical protein